MNFCSAFIVKYLDSDICRNDKPKFFPALEMTDEWVVEMTDGIVLLRNAWWNARKTLIPPYSGWNKRGQTTFIY